MPYTYAVCGIGANREFKRFFDLKTRNKWFKLVAVPTRVGGYNPSKHWRPCSPSFYFDKVVDHPSYQATVQPDFDKRG